VRPFGPARRLESVLRGALLCGTAALYVVGLDRSGWGNSFYAAAAQAGAQNWTAFFFGSSDAGNSITVDKPPAALWVMSLSVRLFGLSSWSLLVPQALMGVAAVALLIATVRRVAGPWAGLLAGLLLAVTPVVTLMFRYDNPDALMTLLVVAAAYTTTRAVEDGRVRWTVATGALLGTAFLAKSLQAFLVLPAIVAVLLVAAPGPLRRRAGSLLAGGAALLVSAGWWPLVVSVIPRADRPWVGGSATDSPLELAFGYNGLGRLTGGPPPSRHAVVHTGSPLRLLGSGGDQIGWVLPAAVILLIAGVVLLRGRPRTDPVRAGLLLWGGWALVTASVLSTMQGIYHSYYTVELAPALAALTAIGGALVWRKGTPRALLLLAGTSAVTTAWSMSLVERTPPPSRSLELLVGGTGALAVGALLMLARTRAATRRGDGGPPALVRRVAVATTALAAVLGPLAWSVATAALPHTGSSVSAGPLPGGRAPKASSHPVLSRAAMSLIRRDADDWTWAAAIVGHRASDLQLTAGSPVMPIGGFGGADPSPTLAQFQSDVAHHRVHWFVAAPTGHGPGVAISAWVRRHAAPVRVGSTTLYDVGALAPSGTDVGP
jgi:4-amino-4-deoxy-L-arabinose transferase-like glycosyltransferase